MTAARAILVWAALGVALAAPIAIAAASPLLAWRDPIYIIGGFAGVAAMAILLLQPLLAGGHLPGLRARRGRWLHARVGAALVLAVTVHVGALWATSPPDVVDALLFRSPTPFSSWGVIAMWAAFAAALIATLRKRLRLKPTHWRLCHVALVIIVVSGSVVHAMLIEGAMGTLSKTMLCALVLAAAAKVVVDLRSWTLLKRWRA